MGVEDPALSKRAQNAIEDPAVFVLRGGRADVAQSAEHPPCKRAVTSSILVVGFAGKQLITPRKCQQFKTLYLGSYPSGQRGLTVNQLSEDFGGSNPSLPTRALNGTASNVLDSMLSPHSSVGRAHPW